MRRKNQMGVHYFSLLWQINQEEIEGNKTNPEKPTNESDQKIQNKRFLGVPAGAA